MTLSFDRQIIKTTQGQIKYRIFHEGGREHYHIGIWLEGSDSELDEVERVEYELHPSFKRRLRTSTNRDNRFSVAIWTWGMFNIDATICFKDGSTAKRSYYLSYDLPPDTGTNYAEV